MSQTSSRPASHLEWDSRYRFRVSFAPGQPTWITDEPQPLGLGEGPAPTEMLAAAVGNCLASSFLFCVRKARIEPRGLTVDVGLKTERVEGRLRIAAMEVHMEPELEDADRARVGPCLEMFESFCTVTESVRRGIPVNLLVEPKRTAIAKNRAPGVSTGA
jgi:organic hydroperoxide reductase OsmC/OhrA